MRHENYDVILQRFYGTDRLPEDILCVPANLKEKYGFSFEEYTNVQTISGREAFIKQRGYLVVNFEITVKSEEGIWYTFMDWDKTELYEDAVAAGWNYLPGDVIRYDLSKCVADDYELGGVE